MTNKFDLQLKLSHLRRVVTKENQYLNSTAQRLTQADPAFLWLDKIDQHEDLAERLDAFVSRFCRLQDTLGDKLLPAYLQSQLEPTSTALDNLNRAEKLGLVPSVETWIEARNLRNSLIHEYTEDINILRQSIKRALELVPMLDAVTRKLA